MHGAFNDYNDAKTQIGNAISAAVQDFQKINEAAALLKEGKKQFPDQDFSRDSVAINYLKQLGDIRSLADADVRTVLSKLPTVFGLWANGPRKDIQEAAFKIIKSALMNIKNKAASWDKSDVEDLELILVVIKDSYYTEMGFPLRAEFNEAYQAVQKTLGRSTATAEQQHISSAEIALAESPQLEEVPSASSARSKARVGATKLPEATLGSLATMEELQARLMQLQAHLGALQSAMPK